MQAGDVITSLNGQHVEYLADFSEVLDSCKVGDTVEVGFTRDGAEHTVQMTLAANEEGAPIIGIYAATARMRLGPIEGLQAAGSMLVMTVQAYASLLNPTTAAETLSQSTSIVGISVMAKQAADAGLFMVLYLLAAVSLSLAVVNLLPVPPLDGGKILVEIIEKVIRRPLPVRVINSISIVVIVLLLLLFVVLLRQDIMNFVFGGMTIFG